MTSLGGNSKMTSISETTSTSLTTNSAADLVGRSGMALFGKKNPMWHPCVVKTDNKDGTIKVQWDEDKKFTKRLPVGKFRLDNGDVEEPADVPFNIFALPGGEDAEDGDY